MVAVPAPPPSTTPALLTLATDVFELVHVPTVVLELKLVVAPWHKVNVPLIADGLGCTVTTLVALHPVLSVYDMVDVPVLAPVTNPDVVTGATLALVDDQLPPIVAELSVLEYP
jgi:hypothetical protein